MTAMELLPFQEKKNNRANGMNIVQQHGIHKLCLQERPTRCKEPVGPTTCAGHGSWFASKHMYSTHISAAHQTATKCHVSYTTWLIHVVYCSHVEVKEKPIYSVSHVVQ